MTEQNVSRRSLPGRLYARLEGLVLRLLAYFEESELGLSRLLVILGGTFALRNILEALAAGSQLYYPAAYFVHFPLAYLPGIVLIPLVLAALSGERVEKTTRLLVLAWTLTILPPLLEIILGNTGAKISYFPIQPGRFWWSVANYFNPSVSFPGATAGVRIEAAVGVVLGAYYIYLKRRKIWLALVSVPVIFMVMVSVFSLPYLFHQLLRACGSTIPNVAVLFGSRGLALRPWLDLSDYSTALFDLLYLTPLLALWLLVYNRRKLGRLARWAFRWQTGGYALVAGLGAWLGYQAVAAGAPLTNPLDWMAVLGGVLAVFHAALGLRLLLPGDAAGDKPAAEDPSDPATLTRRERRNAGAVCLLLAVGYAGTVNYYLLGALAVFAALQAFLHLRPLNLRRLWPLSGLFVGASLLAALAVGLAVFIGGAVTTALPAGLFSGALLIGVLGSWLLERRDEALLGSSLPAGLRRWLTALLPGLGLAATALLTTALWSRVALGALGVGLAALLLSRRVEPRRLGGVWTLAVLLVIAGRLGDGGEVLEFDGLPPNPQALAAADAAADFERNDLHDHALLEWRRAVESGDERAQALGPLAFNLRRLGRLEEAEAVLERSVELYPAHAPALVDLAALKLALGKRDSGEELYQRALELNPRLVQARIGLGRLALEDALAARERGDATAADAALAAAEEYAATARELAPDNGAAAGLLAMVYELSGRYQAAYELWLERVHRAPLDAGARLSLARLSLLLERPTEAAEHLEAARELDPALPIPPELRSQSSVGGLE
jgi:Flp pilus assembly protein TadD